MSFKAIRGMKDILPAEAGAWGFLEAAAREVFRIYNYREIRTPLVEESELFARGVGEASDIVSKQMYVFQDRKGRRLALRPEGTAPVIRAYLEHGLARQGGLQKLFYLGPFFRAERPQAGRGRQFHQLGVEAIGSASPALDAEVISLAVALLEKFSLRDLEINLNSLGCPACQDSYRKVLGGYLKKVTSSLCPDCQVRSRKNSLRVLDCKSEACRELLATAPLIEAGLCLPCREHFRAVENHLQALGLSYRRAPQLVRGLDYYTRTAFEITHRALGAQNTLAAGGRFDNLVKDMGGAPTAAVGFALGIERVFLARGSKCLSPDPAFTIYLAPQGKDAVARAAKLLSRLRAAGIGSDMDYQSRSLKGQLRLANRLAAQYVAIISPEGAMQLKDMQAGTQEELAEEGIISKLKD